VASLTAHRLGISATAKPENPSTETSFAIRRVQQRGGVDARDPRATSSRRWKRRSDRSCGLRHTNSWLLPPALQAARTGWARLTRPPSGNTLTSPGHGPQEAAAMPMRRLKSRPVLSLRCSTQSCCAPGAFHDLVNNRHYPRGIATTVPVKRPTKPLALFRQRWKRRSGRS
jgi:hypothetical protein